MLEEAMIPYDVPIYEFSRSTKGYIDLYTTFGEGSLTRTIPIQCLVIDANTSYNILLG